MNEFKELIYDRERYQFENDLPAETRKVLDWIGPDKKTLELGCHTGHLSEWLQKNGCKVTGIDFNPIALEIAKQFQESTIEGDIENLNFSQVLKNKYEIITCMHILEHLNNPWDVLRKLTEVINSEGYIIIALPNVLNARDRFNFFFGEFQYTKDGVMDKTHLRFFNQQTARALIQDAGLEIVDYFSPWQVNPIYHFLDHLPLIWRLKFFFKPNKVPFIFRHKKNLTDTVMLFKCRLRS